MKRLILLIVLLIGALCNVSAQDRLHPAHTPTSKSDEIKVFITQMYNNKLYEDYDFLRKHCSSGLLKKLQDAYPYDTDGIAYATWLFRSGQQDSKPGADNKAVMWYTAFVILCLLSMALLTKATKTIPLGTAYPV